MKLKHLLSFLFITTIGLVFLQCTLDEGTPGSNDAALTLQAHNELSLIQLEWQACEGDRF
jgi:hypothetical protein